MTQLILFCCCCFSGRESYYVAQTVLVLVILQSQLPERCRHGLSCQSNFTSLFLFLSYLLLCCCCCCFCFILCACIGVGCMPLCMCGDQRTTSDSILCFHHVGSGIKLISVGLAASAFINGVISLATLAPECILMSIFRRRH